jgi:hypothetical protein
VKINFIKFQRNIGKVCPTMEKTCIFLKHQAVEVAQKLCNGSGGTTVAPGTCLIYIVPCRWHL